MKKTGLLIIVVLFAVFSLSASPNWVGVQAFMWEAEQTATVDFSGASATESGKSTGTGVIISGSYYPSMESTFGLGFQLGATATKETTINGITTQSSSDDPLTWRGGLSAQYRADVSSLLGMEVGAGILFEQTKDSDSSSGTLLTARQNVISLLTSATLLVNLTDSFSLVGGIDFVLPLYASIKVSGGGVSVEPDVTIEGFALQGRVGVAFGF